MVVSDMRRFCKYFCLIALVLYLLMIFIFSNQNGNSSAGLSHKITVIMTSFLFKQDSFYVCLIFDRLHYITRKLAHFTEYFGLAILIFFNLKMWFKKQNALWLTLLFALFVAFADEFHQFFISERNANVFDVLIDFLGAFLGYMNSLFLDGDIND